MTPLLAGAPQAVIREFSQQRAQRGRYVSSSAAVTTRSLRFNSADSAYLSRTPASAGNRQTWTWSGWVKRSGLDTAQILFMASTGSFNDSTFVFLESNNTIRFSNDVGNVTKFGLTTTQVFRDCSAWYHLVFVADFTNGTSADRGRIYVNGQRVTTFSSTTYPSTSDQTYINSTNVHYVGASFYAGTHNYSGYLANIHFIDGYAYDPSYFGETNATTGVWDPKTYTGSYGSQGWFLNLADNSGTTSGSNTGIGKDTSGNGNYWNSSGLSVTAGSGNDSLIDFITNGSQTDTGLGGEVVGNYCCWNPLSPVNATYANGNLEVTPGSDGRANSTFSVSSGKWYWEATLTATSATPSYNVIGIGDISNKTEAGVVSTSWVYRDDGKKMNSNSVVNYGASYVVNDVIGVAWDADNGTLTFYKNGSSQGQAYSGLSGNYGPIAGRNSSSTATYAFNFGQRAFAYTAPSGFKALCTANLPTPTIGIGSTAMDVKLWTGNGSTQTISGLNFSPDWVWVKGRNTADNHSIFDSVRGVGNYLASNSTGAEGNSASSLTSFNADGFTSGGSVIGGNGSTYVAWCWDAGSSTVSNTQGSITSTVRANASAGFSIVTYTGNINADQTIGHGLGVAPQFIIVKRRSSTEPWYCYHKFIDATAPANYDISLNSTAARRDYPTFGDVLPTSTVFSVGQTGASNETNETYVAYCFAPVTGYSSFGSYTGTATAGNFVYTGFRPKWIMIKNYSGGSISNWALVDSTRSFANVANHTLAANLTNAESAFGGGESVFGAGNKIDLVSNGFVLREGNAWGNESSTNYIYMAFAESPINYSRAR